MSYNYSYDPWADSNAQHQQQQNQDYTPGGYQSPYNTGQQSAYDDSSSSPYGYYDSNQQHQRQQQPYDEYDEQQQQQQQHQNQSEDQFQKDNKQKVPPLHGFLGRNVPFLGRILDTLSGINLPFIDAMLQFVNRDLLVSKIFYFFFYSAFGSLFPLMGVYFKQLGMNPAQVGILTGIRPFIEIFSAPFWNSLAERFDKAKAMLLFSLLSWIVFTYSLAHIRPPASACVAFNDTDYVLYTPYSGNDLSNYDVGGLEEQSIQGSSAESREVANNNQVHIDKANEGKGEILASEETETDQRRRRRRSISSFPSLAAALDQFERSTQNVRFVSNDDDDGDSGSAPINLVDDFDDVVDLEGGRLREKRSLADYEGSSESEKDEKDVGEETTEKSRDGAEDESSESSESGSENGGSEEAENGEERDEVTSESATATPSSTTTVKPSSTTTFATMATMESSNKTRKVYKQRHKTPPTHIVGMSPITVEYAVNYNKDKHSQFVTPMFSTIVYKLDDIKEVFFLLLLLIALGEFFSAPALTLADSATLAYLGDKTDLYGRQRMFGSLSWAITLLFVGMALDNATSFADHPCGPHQRERSYTVCFMIFSLLMMCAFLTATQFRFSYPKKNNASNGNNNTNKTIVTSTTDGSQVVTTAVDGSMGTATNQFDDVYASTQPRSIFNTAPPINAPPPTLKETKFEYLDKWKSAMFAQRTRELPEWLTVFRQFNNTLHLTYLFITWFLGCGVGLVFTFLFWHLQDVGGTPTLFGICSVINHISEILAYFFSFHFIKRFGHTRVLTVGLGCNIIRFVYVAFLTNPYYALPFELVQGITHAACFAACCSYISHVAKPELRASTQGVMQGLHHGIGRACGTLIGGYMINAIGSRASFCIYGLLSGCVLAGFLYVRKRSLQMGKDDEVKVDDSEALGGYGAPQGVPSAIQGAMVKTQIVD